MYHSDTISRPATSHGEEFAKALSKYPEATNRKDVEQRVMQVFRTLKYPQLRDIGDPSYIDLQKKTLNPNPGWPCTDGKSIVLGGHFNTSVKSKNGPIEISGTAFKYAEGGASSYVSMYGGIYRPVGYALETKADSCKVYMSQSEFYAIMERVKPKVPASQDAALASAIADANSATYDILTDLAEAPETLAMLGGILGGARKALTQLSRLSRKTSRKQLKDLRRYIKKHGSIKSVPNHLSNALGYWLYYRYGVMPLYLSAKDLIEAATRETVTFETSRGNDNAEADGSFEHGPWDVTYRYIAKARGYVKTAWGPGGKPRLKANLPTTLWEVVPFSFVVDWFVGVGDFIDAYTNSQPFINRKGTVSTQLDVEVTCTYNMDRSPFGKISDPPTPFTRDTWTPVTGWQKLEAKGSVVYREKTYSRGLSDLKPKLSPKAQSLIWQRRLDALALGWKLLESLKKR